MYRVGGFLGRQCHGKQFGESDFEEVDLVGRRFLIFVVVVVEIKTTIYKKVEHIIMNS